MKPPKQVRIQAARQRGDLIRFAAKRPGYITEADVTAEEWALIQAEQSRSRNEIEENQRRRAEERRWHKNAFKIYCDGCFDGRFGGIGVISEDESIQIRRKVMALTNNVVECLAAIEALTEAKRLGITNVLLCSDSQLVVNWTNGSYTLKSMTAHRYVPEIRKLLAELNGQIVWIRGTNNPADRLSREAIRQDTRSNKSQLERIIDTPMEALRFRDFANLKVGGWDGFSRLKLNSLQKRVPPETFTTVASEFEDSSKQATCLRWCLRGLPVEKAIRKVKTDIEIGENVRASRSSGEDEWLEE
jgi:ribonuclease HI